MTHLSPWMSLLVLFFFCWRGVDCLTPFPRLASVAAAAALVSWDPTLIKQTESFLSNPVLEALRKAEQWEQDVPNAPNLETTKVLLLYPIVEISQDLSAVSSCLASPSAQCVATSAETLKQPKFQTKTFKKIFNRYSDNIFYSSTTSERANIYLGGGTTPDSAQTTQYLLRNVIITAVQNALQDVAELAQLSDQELRGEDRRLDVQDALSDVSESRQALDKYLALADPQDLATAKAILDSAAH